jgi:Domain of unknown function (DUF4351)/Putative transposase, YhgA-like
MPRINHDRLFKELLTTFFVDFLELFFPELVEHLEEDSLEFIDKEIFTDITQGSRREADLLVKGKVQGRETFFLIHLEHQSKREKDFAQRMFFYFARLTEKFALPVYPIALFSYDKPKTAEKSQYVVSFPNKKVVEFNFSVIQLNQLNWRDFLNKDNAIASALMAKMGIEGADRVTAKKECLRMIARLKIDAARTHLLSGFVDSYLTLLAQERQKLESELKKLPNQEREEVMEITTSWKEEGKIEILCVLLKAKFGDVNKTIQNQLKKLSTEQITEFSKAFLNFTSEKDAEFWLKVVNQKR